jgi:mRNA interferase RelE/StbE
MAYTVEFRPSVLKTFEKIPKRDLVRVKRKVEELGANLPDPDTTKMRGNNSFHRVRTGNYRIIYEIHNDRLVILVVKIGHRKDVYKKLF